MEIDCTINELWAGLTRRDILGTGLQLSEEGNVLRHGRQLSNCLYRLLRRYGRPSEIE